MKHQNALTLIWPVRYDLDHYIIAECNCLAFQAVQAPENWGSSVLILQGEKSSGKTHLMKIFQALHQAVDITSLADLKTALVKDHALLVIDDVDTLLTNDPEAVENLFHLINAMTAKQGKLLLTMTRPAAQWVVLPDLLSRLQAAPNLVLQEPQEDVIKSAYQKLFNDRSLLVDDKVLDYLTMRTERSFAGIQNIVGQLDKASLERVRKITIPLIQTLNLF